MSKYIANIIDTLNYDNSLSELLDRLKNQTLQKIVNKMSARQHLHQLRQKEISLLVCYNSFINDFWIAYEKVMEDKDGSEDGYRYRPGHCSVLVYIKVKELLLMSLLLWLLILIQTKF